MIEKYESRRIKVEIRHVLMDVWDPIGIKDEPNAQDEYDSYLGGVYELLTSGASDEHIEEHLWQIVTGQMGPSAAKQADMAETVKALRRIPSPQNSVPLYPTTTEWSFRSAINFLAGATVCFR